MSKPASSLGPGTVFQHRYEVVRSLRSGGMGAVYEVIHVETRRRCALKVMLPSIVAREDMRARFKLEATAAASVQSEHIVDTFDASVDEETGMPFIVMELLQGEDLAAYVRRCGRLPAPEVVLLLGQAALALDKTHAAGIVHRDLKPENFFLTTRDDGSPRLKILDFGIAKLVAAGADSNTTEILGTPAFMSPEQMRGNASLGPPSDTYALAHVAYRLLVGEDFWDPERRALGNSLPLLLKISRGATEAPSARARTVGVELPAAFDAWFAKATALAPEARYERATELVAALADALGVARPSDSRASGLAPIPVAPPAPAPRARLSATLRRSIAASVALAALLAIWGTVGYVANDARADHADAIVARSAKMRWREPGGFTAKLDMVHALGSCRATRPSALERLAQLPFSGRADDASATCDAAYLDGFHDGFVLPGLKLLEERLAAGSHQGDGKLDALRVYTMLGTGKLGDVNWLATQLRELIESAMRRDDPLLPPSSLKGALWNPVYHYLYALHDQTRPPERIDLALVERAKAAVKAAGK